MRKLLISLTVAVLAVLALPVNAFANASLLDKQATSNLIKNGSFEKPVVPNGSYEGFSTGQTFEHWTVTGASGNVAVVSGTFTQDGFSFPAESGNQWVDLTGLSNTATGVSQSVTTASGVSYLLTFWVGNVYDPGGIFGTTSTVDVMIDGTKVRAAVNAEKGTTQVWKQFKVHFTADSTSTSIAFLNGDPSDDTSNGLDNVTLSKQS